MEIRNFFKCCGQFFVVAFMALGLFGGLPFAAEAANLYFSPSSGSYVVGGSLSVNINVSSADQSMNAVSGVVSFPQDKLEVASISKTGSVCNLWVQEPSFSNTYGTINFECIVLNPGFTGSLGKIIGVNFRSKSQGGTALSFSSGSVLANDGNGTSILTNSSSANFFFSDPDNTETPPVVNPPSTGVLSAPEISSPTHPNQSKWYALNKAQFSWQLPPGTKSIRLLFDRLAGAIPTIEYVPPVSSKEISDIADGIYYFHARTKSVDGWSSVSHFKFQIDTKDPDYFTINEIRRKDLTNPKAKFNFDANDSLSGIDRYEISIDGKDAQTWQDDGTHIFETYPLDPGNHTLSVTVFDRAGNLLTSTSDFIVSPLSKVVITEYPKQLNNKETLIIGGTGPQGSRTVLFMQKEGDEIIQYETQSVKGGSFVFSINDEFKEGSYKVWAQAIDGRGAKSNPSEKVVIVVQRPIFFKIGSLAISFLAILILIVVLVFLLLFLVFWLKHRLSLFRKTLKKEVREAEVVVRKAFDLLENNMRSQVRLLEKTKNKRELTQEESKIVKQMKKDLDSAEKFINKEIEDIKDEIK
ncbi:MAG: hypothetical protein EXS52_00105 [Candidatus Staskawiczbacteria bacterium]|nr:hypothetical protein [Candidatus Staskawiczbacteria bacterium]